MFHNLLQKEQRAAVRTIYYARLWVVACSALTLVVVFGVVMLLPSYLAVRSEYVATQGAAAQYMEAAEERSAVRAQVDDATALVTGLAPFVDPGAVSEYVRQALVVRPETIAVTGFSYSRGRNELVLYGSAATRGDLVAYTDTLEENPVYAKVTLPIGDLAANTDLTFHITLTLAETDVDTETS